MTDTQFSTASKPQLRRRFLIVNGDDFGLSTGVNRAIIEAHTQGILTSTSLMVTGAAFDQAVELAKSHPNLGVGLHLTLGKGKAVLPHSKIPHLVDAEGHFPNDTDRAGVYYQFNADARRQLSLEIRAQLEKFRATGLKLSHVDGHRHMHSNPVILRALVDLAEEFDIRVIRLPSEELGLTLNLDRRDLKTKLLWWTVFSGLRLYGERVLKARGVGFVDRVYGLLQSGQMTEDYLIGLIPQIRANLVEIYSHPAVPESTDERIYGGQKELDALLSDRVRSTIAAAGFELANYNDWDAITQPDETYGKAWI